MLLGIYAELFPLLAWAVVLTAWCLLALGRRWRREPGWIDGLGLLVGLNWIVLSLVYTYMLI